VSKQFDEWWLTGTFFLALGVLQLRLGVARSLCRMTGGDLGLRGYRRG
jgi:hypothetical protein